MARVDGNLESCVLEDADERDVIGRYSIMIVTDDDAEQLYYDGEELTVAFELMTPQHGRQVFFQDSHGNWWGLKGIGLPLWFRTNDPMGWNLSNDKTVNLVFLSDDSSHIIGCHGLISFVSAQTAFAQGDYLAKTEGQLFPGRTILTIQPNQVWLEGKRVNVDDLNIEKMEGENFVGFGIELVYYGKHLLRMPDLRAVDRETALMEIQQVLREEGLPLGDSVNETALNYANYFVSYIVKQGAERYYNNGRYHGNLRGGENGQNFMVNAPTVDFDTNKIAGLSSNPADSEEVFAKEIGFYHDLLDFMIETLEEKFNFKISAGTKNTIKNFMEEQLWLYLDATGLDVVSKAFISRIYRRFLTADKGEWVDANRLTPKEDMVKSDIEKQIIRLYEFKFSYPKFKAINEFILSDMVSNGLLREWGRGSNVAGEKDYTMVKVFDKMEELPADYWIGLHDRVTVFIRDKLGKLPMGVSTIDKKLREAI